MMTSLQALQQAIYLAAIRQLVADREQTPYSMRRAA